jgi:RNA polymerase sigma-70 factor (ECF subfamily)
MMREFIGLESSEICNELALSTTNLHVMLHRARLSLQKCLDSHWFKENS